MRGSKAKRLRTPERPNPGRKHGGAGKLVEPEEQPEEEPEDD